MANGGVVAPVGLNMVALAAEKHAVPFVILAGTHKVLCCAFSDLFLSFGPLISRYVWLFFAMRGMKMIDQYIFH